MRIAQGAVGLWIEKVGQSVEVILGQHFQQVEQNTHALSQFARDGQRKVLQARQFGIGNPLRLTVKQVEQLQSLDVGNRRLAQQQELAVQLVGVLGAGPAMGQGQPFKNALDVGFRVR